MILRKLTSLVMMIGLILSLFHPLAHVDAQQSPDQHGSFAVQYQSGQNTVPTSLAQSMAHIEHFQIPSSGPDGLGFATVNCDVCHVFAHIFAIGSTENNPPVTKMLRLVGIGTSPVTAEVLRFKRPPRLIL